MRSLSLAIGLAVALAASGLGQTTVFDWHGSTPGAYFGSGACVAGDLNGNGVPDIVVHSTPNQAVGQIVALSGFDGFAIWTVAGGSFFGGGPLPVGDVNGDGVPDVAVQRWWLPAPPVTSPEVVSVLSGATGVALWTAGPVSDNVGHLVDAGPDVNGDGKGDVLVNWRQGFGNWSDYRTHSGPSGGQLTLQNVGDLYTPSSACLMPDVSGDGLGEIVLGLPQLNQVTIRSGPGLTLVHTLTGPSLSKFGSAVSAVGDVNGDGWCDLAVTSLPVMYIPPFSTSPLPPYTGVYSGATGALLYTVSSTVVAGAGGRCVATPDLNGDGRPELVFEAASATPGIEGRSICSGADGSVLVSQPSTSFEIGAIFSGADFTGDGVPEFLFGEPNDDGAATDAGRLRIISPLALPLAYALDLGGACGSVQPPVMTASPLGFGSLATIALTGGTPNAIGNLAVDFAPDVPTTLSGGCVFHLDPSHSSSWIYFPVTTNAAGAFTIQVGVPTVPHLAGSLASIQVALLGTPALSGFDLSNGLRITLGY